MNIETTTSGGSEPAAAPAAPSRKGLWIGIAVLLVGAILAGGAVLYYLENQREGGGETPKATVTGFIEAVRAGDLDKTLGYLREGPAATLKAGAEKLSAFMDPGKALKRFTKLDDYADLEILDEAVSGDEAKVRFRLTVKGKPIEREVVCVREGGAWRLARLPLFE